MAVRLAYVNHPSNAISSVACKTSTTVYAGQIVVNDSGAIAAATGAQTDAAVIGLCVETSTSGGTCKFVPISNIVLEMDVDRTGSKTTFAAADLGTLYDMSVSSTNQFIDPDDTTGGWLKLVGYDNDRGVAFAMVTGVDLMF